MCCASRQLCVAANAGMIGTIFIVLSSDEGWCADQAMKGEIFAKFGQDAKFSSSFMEASIIVNKFDGVRKER